MHICFHVFVCMCVCKCMCVCSFVYVFLVFSVESSCTYNHCLLIGHISNDSITFPMTLYTSIQSNFYYPPELYTSPQVGSPQLPEVHIPLCLPCNCYMCYMVRRSFPSRYYDEIHSFLPLAIREWKEIIYFWKMFIEEKTMYIYMYFISNIYVGYLLWYEVRHML